MIRYWTCNNGLEDKFVLQRTWPPYGPAPDYQAGGRKYVIEPMGSFLPFNHCPVLRQAFQNGVAAGKAADNAQMKRYYASFGGNWCTNPYADNSALWFKWELGYRRGARKHEKVARHERLRHPRETVKDRTR